MQQFRGGQAQPRPPRKDGREINRLHHKGRRGFVQPRHWVPRTKYLRIIYGPEYLLPET